MRGVSVFAVPPSHPAPHTATPLPAAALHRETHRRRSPLQLSTGKLTAASYGREQSIGVNRPQLRTCNCIINFPLNKTTSRNAAYPPFSIVITLLISTKRHSPVRLSWLRGENVNHVDVGVNDCARSSSNERLRCPAPGGPRARFIPPQPNTPEHEWRILPLGTATGRYRSCNTICALSAKPHQNYVRAYAGHAGIP